MPQGDNWKGNYPSVVDTESVSLSSNRHWLVILNVPICLAFSSDCELESCKMHLWSHRFSINYLCNSCYHHLRPTKKRREKKSGWRLHSLSTDSDIWVEAACPREQPKVNYTDGETQSWRCVNNPSIKQDQWMRGPSGRGSCHPVTALVEQQMPFCVRENCCLPRAEPAMEDDRQR